MLGHNDDQEANWSWLGLHDKISASVIAIGASDSASTFWLRPEGHNFGQQCTHY